MPTAHADIATTRAERHLNQLCDHLGQLTHHSRHSTREHDDSLSITLVAETGDELDRLQQIMAARLETIGRRDQLIVTWTLPGNPPASTI